MSDITNRLVEGYYATWGAGDFEGLAALLSDDFAFRGAMDSAAGPQAFIELIRRNAPAFEGARFADVRLLVDGNRAVSLYAFELGPVSVPMAEAFEVRGDRIARVDLYFDPARFTSPEALSGG